MLAIFELANCFRHGWGISKDAVAAKQVCLFPSPTFVFGTWGSYGCLFLYVS